MSIELEESAPLRVAPADVPFVTITLALSSAIFFFFSFVLFFLVGFPFFFPSLFQVGCAFVLLFRS